ncbi:MAG TPA: thioredoxin domain-containing protein [Candidatus Binatia bacterium]|nr:thioredoxin domain-containing protein [Candidatus Binatia bacterium]
MGKASKAKAAVRLGPADPPWVEPPLWSTWLLGLSAAAGLILGSVATWVHHQVVSSGGAYTSFCNVNNIVNCDSVVTSPYGSLFSVPVSVWAMVFYGILLVLVVTAAGPPSESRNRARADAFAWAVAGTVFSAYLAFISAFVLKALCLICAGLYTVSVVALGAAWIQASPLREAVRRLLERWRMVGSHPGLATAAVGTVIGVFVVSGWLGAQTRLTREQVFRSNPQFYDWYTNQPIIDTPIDGGYAHGPENAPIQLVEFSDFECPHCALAYVTLKDLLPRYQNQIRFIYHNFPLSNDCNSAISQKGHAHACRAAVAGDCAAQQGRFQPYSNLLFANQGNLDDKSLAGYAKQVGLDVDAFETCLNSTAAAERVADDIKRAQKAGVKSTPTFFINNRKVEGNMTFENWLLAFAVELDKG